MSTMAQYAALAGFEPATRDILDERRELFRQRRDFLPAVQELGLRCPCATGGVLHLCRCQPFTSDSQAFCMQLLEEHGVAADAGSWISGIICAAAFRFSYTTGMERLELRWSALQACLPELWSFGALMQGRLLRRYKRFLADVELAMVGRST